MDEEKMKEYEKRIGIYLNCKTRNGNLNGFYNFESDEVNSINFFFEVPVHIGDSKYKNIIIFDKSHSKLTDKGTYLFRIFIKKKDDEIPQTIINYVYNPPDDIFKEEGINWDKFLWRVINSSDIPKLEEMKGEDYILGENDILKIGSYKYLISKIHIKDKKIEKKDKFCDFSPPLKKVKKCEFCGEIMVSLCNCEEYFHVEEIKKWISERLKKKVKNKTINYYFEIAQCEGKKKDTKDEKNNENENTGCNFYYPLNFKYDPDDLGDSTNLDLKQEKTIKIEEGKKEEKKYIEVNLFDFEIPKDKDYMILESFPQKEAIQNSNKNVKSVHIVELTGGPIKIGRKERNDIILEDNKVSSEHAIIEYHRSSGNLIIKNLSQHFGTLALIYSKDKYISLNQKPIFFQANKSLLETNVMSLSDYLKYKKNLNSDYPLVFENTKKDK